MPREQTTESVRAKTDVEQSSAQRRPANVLFVIHYPMFGGPHNQVMRLRSQLLSRGYALKVLLPREPGNAVERLASGGVAVYTLPFHRVRASLHPAKILPFALGFLAEVTSMSRLFTRERIDLVVIAGLINPHSAFAARRSGVPIIWKILDTRTPRLARPSLMALVRRFADVAMFDGESLIAQHVGGRGLSIPTHVYYPPVATSEFVPSPERRAALRGSLGIPSDAYLIGTVANLNPQKGIEYFIHAARLIADQIEGAWFVIVGAEYRTHRRYANELRQMVSDLGLRPERVIFAGDRPDVQNWYAAMDIKLITSVPNSEGTTTTAMEAMSCGVPVVASDVGSVRDVVQHGVTGLLVPPKDAAAIAGATLSILKQADVRARMSVAAREAAVRLFDVEVCADSHAEAFAAAIRRRQFTSDHERVHDDGTWWPVETS